MENIIGSILNDMNNLHHNDDHEQAHIDADKLLIKLIIHLSNYQQNIEDINFIIDSFNSLKRFYS